MSGEDQATDQTDEGGGGGWSSVWPVLVPALTFLVGLGLGAGVLWLSGNGEDTDAEPTSPTSATESASGGDTVVVVPAACEDAADNLQDATALLDDVAGSIRDFRPNELVDLLNQLEEIDRETRALASECSAEVSVTEEPSATVTGVPEETEDPETDSN